MKKVVFTSILTLIMLLFSLLAVELILRKFGFKHIGQSAELLRKFGNSEPIVNIEDSELGWKNRPGKYKALNYESFLGDFVTLMPLFQSENDPAVINNYLSKYKTNNITILPDGSRATSDREKTSNKNILITGGSFTYGLGLDDSETYPWKLQNLFPEHRVVNLASSGYGSYQSLLHMEKFLTSNSADIIIYSYIQNHDYRNVGTAEHIKHMNIISRSGKKVYVPFCSIDEDGNLIRNEPETFEMLPFSTSSSIMYSLSEFLIKNKTKDREKDYEKVTFKIINEMNLLAKKHSAKFYLTLLQVPDKTKTELFSSLDEIGVTYLDCDYEDSRANEFMLPVMLHPNEKLNNIYTKCIASQLRK